MVRDIGKVSFPKGKGNNVHIIIYVPSTKNINKTITPTEMRRRVNTVSLFLSRTFGGTTNIKGTGTFESKKRGVLVRERVTKVETFTRPMEYKKAQVKIRKKLRKWKKAWGQESMGYEFEESLYFI